MSKVNILYKVRKNDILGFYDKFKNIDIETILDVNDKIVDVYLKKENFDNPLEEFFNIVAMCSYMVDNDLYDEYFFDTFEEILEEYKEHKFDDDFLDSEDDKKVLNDDISNIIEFLSQEEGKMNYYDSLSEIFTEQANK